ncbi:retrovirus-related Pol polyprotein from transposon TNT 1-94, partial [Trifolium medium]|nr:retrovirus-related Pol polyprotein from transposon TNT 1-94 [Trifolium medium]
MHFFSNVSSHHSKSSLPNPTPDPAYLDDLFHYDTTSHPTIQPNTQPTNTSPSISIQSTPQLSPQPLNSPAYTPSPSSSHTPTPSSLPPPPAQLRRSTRPTTMPGYLQDYHCNLLTPAIHASHSSDSNASSSRAIGCKWVFKLKLNVDGTVERYKERLVAKGFTQTEGLDYLETFSHVVKITNIRILMAITASQNWPLFQLDVNTTFLHGDLNEEVYMKPPPGLDLPHPDLVCKLQRSLYGLKQASRQWNTKLTDTLISSGYIQSKSDYSLFTKQSHSGFTVVLVYVDDLVLGGTDMNEITTLKNLLNDKFSIKDLGVLKYFLGFEVDRTSKGISLCQRKYTLDLLTDAGLLGAKPCTTPMQPHLQLHKTSDTSLSDPTAYRRLIGRLLYLTHSRPEISYD